MEDERIPLTMAGKIACWLLRPEIAKDAIDDWRRFVARSRISTGQSSPIRAMIDFNIKGGE